MTDATSGTDVVVFITTSGRVEPGLAHRIRVLDLDGDVRPEMASLTFGSLNSPKQASVNAPETIQELAARMRDRAIVAEWEILDLGVGGYAAYLRAKGLLPDPVYANILLGSLGTLQATPLNLALAVERLPTGATWAATGIGRYQLEMNRLAIAMRGHVRVGLEDNFSWDADWTKLATSPRLVERLVRIGRAMGREPASPAQLRQRLGIPPPPGLGTPGCSGAVGHDPTGRLQP